MDWHRRCYLHRLRQRRRPEFHSVRRLNLLTLGHSQFGCPDADSACGSCSFRCRVRYISRPHSCRDRALLFLPLPLRGPVVRCSGETEGRADDTRSRDRHQRPRVPTPNHPHHCHHRRQLVERQIQTGMGSCTRSATTYFRLPPVVHHFTFIHSRNIPADASHFR